MLAQSTQLAFKTVGTKRHQGNYGKKAIQNKDFLIPEIFGYSHLESQLCESSKPNIGWPMVRLESLTHYKSWPPYHLACDPQNPTLIEWLFIK